MEEPEVGDPLAGRRDVTLDIESAIDYLSARGLVDPTRVGVGGHSWGGYLSAFLATTSNRFKAALVDSGILPKSISYSATEDLMSQGKLAMMISGPWAWASPTLRTSAGAGKTRFGHACPRLPDLQPLTP